ncbi:MAG TPA: FAD-binding oxidoreductase [Solirubrobacteraceae bacterium]|jgi:sarcosine oxidase subunit beta|nr:FAD-binding oxidoreductase [Solirubrobacteraceae bacterium]
MAGERLVVCVVGAGAIGLSSALELTRRGCEVTVIDARHVAAGSSGLSVGIVETQYLDRLDIELRVRAMRTFDWLEREHGLRVVRNGYLRLAHDDASRLAFERSVEIQHELGVRDAQVLDRAEIARLVPCMRTDDVQAGLFGRSDGFIDGHLYCGLLAELAVREGAKLLVATELQGAAPLAGGGLRLKTSSGELECDVTVDAAGPWAGRVARLLGHELDLAPQRHQASLVQLPYELPYTMPSVMDYTPGSGERGLYFRHEGSSRLIAGLHGEEVSALSADPDSYVRQADDEFLEELARKLSSRLPALADAALAGGWAGLYPVSATGRPLVGPIAPGAPVIVAGGAGGSGIQLSPVMGELAADWVLHGEPRAVVGARRLVPGLRT